MIFLFSRLKGLLQTAIKRHKIGFRFSSVSFVFLERIVRVNPKKNGIETVGQRNKIIDLKNFFKKRIVEEFIYSKIISNLEI